MLLLLKLLVWTVCALARSRQALVLDNLALRHQLATLAHRGGRTRLKPVDRLFWVGLRTAWTEWAGCLIDLLGGSLYMEVHPVRISFQSPWQNGVAERWVGSCRRELLDHVIMLNEPHLRRLLHEFLAYYHGDRTHLSLGKDPPLTRALHPPPEKRG